MPYDPCFIDGQVIPIPGLSETLRKDAYQGGQPIEHLRFSIIFHEVRDLAICTAHNIDGSSLIPEGQIRRRNNFRTDPTVPSVIQVDNDRGYSNNPWDRGHLVRRRALHWGNMEDAIQADRESFYWTNIAPQHTSLHATAWSPIENWLFSHIEQEQRKAAVFTGPIFANDDAKITNKEGEASVIIPAGFWKVAAVEGRDADDLLAVAFLVWQRDYNTAEPAMFTPFLEQVRITTIEYLTGLDFGDLRFADPLRAPDAGRSSTSDVNQMKRYVKDAGDIFTGRGG